MQDTIIKDLDAKMVTILSHYSGGKDELINILQEVQEQFHYLPEEAMKRVAVFLGLHVSNVYSVASFYALFRFTPSGKKIVRVCRGTACHVRGGSNILDQLRKRLGIKPGETTKDMEYTLETVACIGACALAPNISIDKTTYGLVNSDKLQEVFGDYKKPE
jgi:NADH-quinone oxidoreductase subunit E/NADP-reducing hydrogenase subunit HndA